MVEAGRGQRRQPLAAQQHAGGDEVRIEPCLGGRSDQRLEVAARRRLAAREVNLQRAQLGRLGDRPLPFVRRKLGARSEEHTSELQSLMRISYAVFCLKKKKITTQATKTDINITT